MIRNLTYNDPHIRQEVEAKIGKPFSWWDRLKMGGIGSQRLVIQDASAEILPHLERNNHIRYSNIELRNRGIIIGFFSGTNRYGLIIDFEELLLTQNGQQLMLSGKDFFIELKPLNNDVLDVQFLEKLMKVKDESKGFV